MSNMEKKLSQYVKAVDAIKTNLTVRSVLKINGVLSKGYGSFIIFNLKRLSYHNKVTADAVTKAVVNMRINPATAHKNEDNV